MTDPISNLLGPLFGSPAMRAVVDDRARLQRMLDFELALTRAQSSIGIVPALAADPIVKACQAERYNIAALAEAARLSGNIVMPLIEALTEEVTKASTVAATYVHWGPASQDVIDTALVLELRAAIDVLLADLDLAIEGFATLAGRHRRTPFVARTQMQQALPMPFGLKLAGYAAALGRSRDRLRRLRKEALFIQFGGAAGTLAAFGEQGFEIVQRTAALLDLPLPDAPWHSHRDRLGEVAAAFGILTATCGKIARDVSLMMQTEVGETLEPAAPGRGGSSTMPHKRNPIAAGRALAAATMAPNLVATILAAAVQEHERGLGGWQAEWPTFPALELVTSGALAAITEIAQGLEVDGDRMRIDLEASRGLIMAEAVTFALAAKIGKREARGLVEAACRKAAAEKLQLRDVLAADPRVSAQLTGGELVRLFEPMSYQGQAQAFIERQVAPLQQRGSKRF
jgi:3-carboxy-cis,cis-muconate cycloisomerase